MLSEPYLETRDAQAYIALRTSVQMKDFPAVIDRSLGELRSWIGQHGLEQQAGPPIFRYLKIDTDGAIDIEFCIPLSMPASPDERVQCGTLPAGQYATMLHTGHYDGLREATRRLLEWGDQQGLKWQVDAAGVWRARLETYLTDPGKEPDPSRWETQLAILIAD